jgi:DNA polymerase-3 subunit epsilon
MLQDLLSLERPLIVFDTETTGTNPRADRVIEIACLKVHPDGRREQWLRRINPGIPIPPASTAIHGITDADVAGEPRFRELAPELAAFLAGCDLAGYNIAGFDLPVLRAEFLRAGVAFEVSDRRLVDAQRIFFSREPRHLAAAARFYCQSEHAGAHGALADAEMTLRVLEGQLERGPSGSSTIFSARESTRTSIRRGGSGSSTASRRSISARTAAGPCATSGARSRAFFAGS